MDPARTTTTTAALSVTGELAHGPDGQRKLLSSLRLKVLLTLFVVLLVAGLSALIFYLVSGIFARLTPLMREDLEWKTARGALELAHGADLAMAVGDSTLVQKSFGDYAHSRDVVAIVATDARGKVLAVHGTVRGRTDDMFAGSAGVVRPVMDTMVAWAPSVIEGNTVGKVALAVSTARLEEGERLRRRLLAVGGMGCLLALGVSLFFVNFYLVPLITLSQQGLRTAREMEIAKRIQTSILPRQLRVEGVDLSAAMVPAEEVGGDYYDVIPVQNGCWIGIGDVAGHGVRAGLVMMMLQSIVSALVKRQPDARPNDILEVLNAVLFENIRHRLRSDEHVTFSLLHLARTGRLTYAGAHEELIVCRARTGQCERIETQGTWLGATRSIKRATTAAALELEPGDLLVLHTDGITEAADSTGQQFGIERLCDTVARHRERSTDEIRARVMEAVARWTHEQEDDQTIVVLRFQG